MHSTCFTLFPNDISYYLCATSFLSVTALMHGDRDPSIAAMVLDSPFSDLSLLCEQMVDKARDQGINVPGFVSSVAIRMIRGSVRRQADFDIRDVSPISHAPHCFIPALFVAAENDDFITKSHSQSLHEAYAGDANMIVVDGKRTFCMMCVCCCVGATKLNSMLSILFCCYGIDSST
jgi:hypothetical protein